MYLVNRLIVSILGAALLTGVAAPWAAAADDAGIAAITDWVVLGPFPNPAADDAEAPASRAGFDIDYLETLGGEAAARIDDDTEVAFTTEEGIEATRRAFAVAAGDAGIVDLLGAFGGDPQTSRVAYAFAWLDAKEAGETHVLFGSDDWAQVFVNGERVHRAWENDLGRACVPRQEHFVASLREGRNAVLVKVDQNTGPWEFIVETATPEAWAAVEEEQARRDALYAVMDSRIEPPDDWFWTFPPGTFPDVRISDGVDELLQEAYGPFETSVRWFDGDLEEVDQAKAPGRYAAYLEARFDDGRVYRRARTFYCCPPDWQPWNRTPEVEWGGVPGAGIDDATWQAHAGTVNRWAGDRLVQAAAGSPEGAVFLAGMHALSQAPSATPQLDWPETRDQDYHVRLKRKVLGLGDAPGLAPPRHLEEPAPALHEGSYEDAGVDPDAIDGIREACRAWVDATSLPCTVLLARRGVVFFHEAFGEFAGEPTPLDAKMPLASITKSHCGMVFARFLDQGLIALDDPVGRYLPGFPTEGPQAITLRHCMAHTTGYEGHGEWGGLENPWLDNAMAFGLEPLAPGKRFLYNGMGFDLTGKVMEVVSGKGIYRLMQEQLFIPLGDDHPTIIDLGYGVTCSVEDLARYGQMILNKGSYGDREFFSVETFDEHVVPRPLGEFFPELTGADAENRYNMGLHFYEPAGDDPPAYGPMTLMHGAASGAVLRMDYDHDLVVAMGRIEPGPDYDVHLRRFEKAVTDALVD